MHINKIKHKHNGKIIFPHKNIYKTTWVSLDHLILNQIDNICISDKFRTSLIGIRVMMRVEVTSNNFLVFEKLKY